MHDINLNHRRQTTIRFFFYGLCAVFVIGLTVILVKAAQGYAFDREQRRVIQTGLIQLKSEPIRAPVYINGELKLKRTPGRINLAGGTYDLEIRADKYRPWRKTLGLKASDVVWLTYARLLPNKIASRDIGVASSLLLTSQSLDQRWIVNIVSGETGPQVQRYDTREDNLKLVDTTALNQNLFVSEGQTLGKLDPMFWSEDGKWLVIKHTNAQGSSFVLYRPVDPANSLNLTRTFALPIDDLEFKAGSEDEMYISQAGKIHRLNVNDRTITAPLIENTHGFTAHPADGFVAVALQNDRLRLLRLVGDKKTVLFDFGKAPATIKPFGLVASQYEDNRYLLATDPNQSLSYLFRGLEEVPNGEKRLQPVSRQEGVPTKLIGFSRNGEFAAMQFGNEMWVYHIDEQDRLTYTLPGTVNESLLWHDSHHLGGWRDGQAFVMDYDGENNQLLLAAEPFGIYFNRVGERLYTLRKGTAGSQLVLRQSELVVKE